MVGSGVDRIERAKTYRFRQTSHPALDIAALITFGVSALLVILLTRGGLGYKPDSTQH